MPAETELRPCNTICVKLAIDIAAPVGVVWKTLLDDIGEWWTMANFAATGGTMHLEARAGGRLYEVGPNGHELLWAHVIEILPEKRIFFHGAMGAPYAPASITLFQFNLESTANGTRLSIRDELFGNVNEKTTASMTEGWTHLFSVGLKQLVEGRSKAV